MVVKARGLMGKQGDCVDASPVAKTLGNHWQSVFLLNHVPYFMRAAGSSYDNL